VSGHVERAEAVARLGSVLGGAAPAMGAADGAARLVAACRRLGEVEGIRFAGRAPLAGGPGAIEAMAMASRLRCRSVALRGRWWTRPATSLLARRWPGGDVVALLAGGGRYRIYDPESGATRVVTAALAATLEPRAWMFYRPLPDAWAGARQLVAFGLRGARGEVAALGLAAAAASLVAMAVPLATGAVVGAVLAGQASRLTSLALLVGLAVAAAGCLTVVRNVAVTRVQGRMQAVLEPAVWDRLLSLRPSFYRRYATGELVARANGIDGIRRVLGPVTVGGLLGAVFSAFSLALLLALDAGLGLVTLGATAVLSAGIVLLAWRQLPYDRAVSRQFGQVYAVLYPVLLGIDKVRAAGREPHAFSRWTAAFAAQKRADVLGLRWEAASLALTAALPPLLLLALFGAIGLTGARVAPATFVAVTVAMGQFVLAAGQVTRVLVAAFAVLPVYERLRAVLEAPVETAPGAAQPGRLSGAIRIEDVTFAYERTGRPLLEGLTMRFEPGELVAIVGPSGAGKSTVVRLLLGFEHPARGRVLYDGRDLRELDLPAVRRQIGVVLQHGRVSSGPILEHIVGLAAGATEEDAWAAAEIAGLADDIRRLPMGMWTRLGSDGHTLSGGQVQRLLVARAVAGRPPVLVLDEATSALDDATQRAVIAGIARTTATRIVIAHRLSTIEGADWIYVLDGGRVVGEGTYRHLLRANRRFAELVEHQVVR